MLDSSPWSPTLFGVLFAQKSWIPAPGVQHFSILLVFTGWVHGYPRPPAKETGGPFIEKTRDNDDDNDDADGGDDFDERFTEADSKM